MSLHLYAPQAKLSLHNPASGLPRLSPQAGGGAARSLFGQPAPIRPLWSLFPTVWPKGDLDHMGLAPIFQQPPPPPPAGLQVWSVVVLVKCSLEAFMWRANEMSKGAWNGHFGVCAFDAGSALEADASLKI